MKIAMIGAGWVANEHCKYLSLEPDVEIVAHVAPITTELEQAIDAWGGRGYADIHALLENETIDAAWICVPPNAHGDIEYSLLERDIPFFFEKPLSADRQTGEAIGAAIAEKGLMVAVGYHWRAMDVLPQLRELLADNPVRMVIGHWHDSTPPPTWWQVQSMSGGQMVEQATHLVDLARHLLGEATVRDAVAMRNIRPNYPDADVHDVSAALLQFPENVPGIFTATCLLGRGITIHLQLICEGLLITLDHEGIIYDYGVEREVITLQTPPFLVENRAFLQALRNNDPSLLYCTYADALLTHRLCHDILEASLREDR